MKNKHLLICSFATIVCTFGQSHGRSSLWNRPSWGAALTDNKQLIVGDFKFPKGVSRAPNIATYFNGTKLELGSDDKHLTGATDTSFMFRADKFIDTFHVLVTENVLPHVQNSTIEYLQLAPEQSYKCYRVTRTHTDDEGNVGWAVMPEMLEKTKHQTLQVPANTLIALINPEFVEGLEQTTWHEGNPIAKFANIVVKQSVSQTELDRSCISHLLASIDVNAFHKREKPQVKRSSGVVISMLQEE